VYLVVDIVQPLTSTIVQVSEGGKFPAIQEVVFDIADRTFNLALGLGSVDPAEPGSESKVVS